MPTKKQRIDVTWIAKVVELVQENGNEMDLSEVYVSTKVNESTQTESYLTEQPSLTIVNRRVCFHAFVAIANVDELFAFLQRAFPRAYRISDLYGLYPFIANDISALIFEDKVRMLDDVSKTITCVPSRRHETLRLRMHISAHM